MPYLMESADLYVCYVPTETEIMSYTYNYMQVRRHSSGFL